MARVCDIMRQDIMPLKIDDPILKAWRLMVQYKLDELPVVETGGRLAGVFTERRPLVHAVDKPTWWRALFGEIYIFARDYRRAFATTVGELMVPARISVDPATSLEAATALVLRFGLDILPVVTDGTLIGVVTRTDMTHATASLIVPR